MAFGIRSSTTNDNGSANTITITKPAGTVEGDWLVVILVGNDEHDWSDDNGSTPFTFQTQIQQSAGGSTMEVWYRKAGASEPANYTFDYSITDRVVGVMFAVEDGSSSMVWDVAPSGSNSQTDESLVGDLDALDITTIEDGAIHITACQLDSAGGVFNSAPSGYTTIQHNNDDGNTLWVDYDTIATAGATGDQNYDISGTRYASSFSFSLAPAAPAGQFVLPTANNLHAATPTSNTRYLATIGTATGIGTKPLGSLPLTDNAGQFQNNQVAGTVVGMGYEFQASQAAWDLSTDTKVMLWAAQWNAPNRMQVDNLASGGTRMRIYSGSGSLPSDYKEFYLGGNDTPQAASVSGQYPFTIDLNDDSEDANGGTFDNTDVTSYAYLFRKGNITGTSYGWTYMSKMYILDTTKASASTPHFIGDSDPEDAVLLIAGTDYTDKLGNWVRQNGSAVFIDMGFKIGDNSTHTTFDDLGLTIISPAHNDPADPRVRVTTQALRTYLNLRDNSNDTAIFSGTWVWQTRAPFDWDQENAAVVTFSNPTFKGMGDFTLGGSVSGPATFDDVDVVIVGSTSTDLDGSTFKNQNGDHALYLEAGVMDIADMRFESYASAHAILIDTAGTYEFDNVFFDQSGTNDVENTSGGLVTINIVNGGTVPTVTNTGGGSTTTVNNNVAISIHVIDTDGDDIEDARVYLIANETVGTITTGDVLLNDLTSALGIVEDTAFNYEAAFNPTGLDCLLTVRKGSASPYFKPIEKAAVTITTAGFSTNAAMVSDE